MSLMPPHVGAPEGHLAAVAVEGRLHSKVRLGVIRVQLIEEALPLPLDDEERAIEVMQEEVIEVTGEGDPGGGD
jgi:hypothetical protein